MRNTRENIPLPPASIPHLDSIAYSLAKQIDKEVFARKYAPAAAILKIVAGGAFLAASAAFPNLPTALKPFQSKENEYEAWKRFNIPYLKRTLERLEKQKLVETHEEKNIQVVQITNRGKQKILKMAIDELAIEKPKHWDKIWRLISYDIPGDQKDLRNAFREYIRAWGFYPLHESVFLHAYPCETQVEFLREYLGIGHYVRIFKVIEIENDEPFRNFFEV